LTVSAIDCLSSTVAGQEALGSGVTPDTP